MRKAELLPEVSQAEFRVVCKKIFEIYHVAIVGCDDIFEVNYETKSRRWMRKRVSRSLVTPEFIGYVIGCYVIVFEVESKKPLLAFEMLPFSANDPVLLPWAQKSFILRVRANDNAYLYRLYELVQGQLETSNYRREEPEGFKNISAQPYVGTTQHEWRRVWVEKPDVKSVDNSIYYDFILNSID